MIDPIVEYHMLRPKEIVERRNNLPIAYLGAWYYRMAWPS